MTNDMSWELVPLLMLDCLYIICISLHHWLLLVSPWGVLCDASVTVWSAALRPLAVPAIGPLLTLFTRSPALRPVAKAAISLFSRFVCAVSR